MLISAGVTNFSQLSGEVALSQLPTPLFTADATGRGKFASLFINTGLLADNSVTLGKLAGGTAGKVIGFDGSGDPAELDLSNFTLVAEIELGSVATSIDFTGLDINTDGTYFFVFTFENVDAALNQIFLDINGDNVNTNYHRQVFQAVNGTLTGARANNNHFLNIAAGESCAGHVLVLIDAGGFAKMVSVASVNDPAAIEMFNTMCATASTVANITQVTFEGTKVDGLGVGSKVQLYKLTT